MSLSDREVPPIGPTDAKIVLVGEAPGEREDQEGQPFVGHSGGLLNTMLREAGIEREKCFITNVVNRRPANNDFGVLYEDKGRKKPTEVLVSSYARLRDEVNAVNPNVIVALGGEAFKALTGIDGISKWRGSVVPSTLCPGKKVIGTYHPAAIMRQFGWRPVAVMDLTRAVQQSEFPDIRIRERNLIVGRDFAVLKSELERILGLHESTRVSLDIETSESQVQCISFATERYRAVSIPFFWRGTSIWSEELELELWRLVKAILQGPFRKIIQNAEFDTLFLKKKVGIEVNNLWMDTMVAQHMIYPELQKGLDFLCAMYTDHPYYKDDIDSDDPEVFWRYNALDSCIAWEVHEEQLKELKEFKTDGLYFNFVHKLIEPLQEIGDRGILIDTRFQQDMRRQINAELIEAQIKLDAIAGHPLNVNSPKQMVKFLYEELPNAKQTKSRKKKGSTEYEEGLTTDEATIDKLNRQAPNPAYDLILELRGKRKLLSTYIEAAVDTDGRLRTTYKVTGTKSGRLSSSSTIFGIGLNVQNVPPGPARRMFISDPGTTFIQGDLSQAEARVVAYLAEEERLINVFKSGGDIHKQNAAIIFQKSVNDVAPTERQLAKKIVHASNYGMGPRRFREVCWEELGVELTESEAKKLQRAYFLQFPRIERWHLEVQQQLNRNRTLTTPYGRKRIFFGFYGDELFKEAYSYIPQSTIADHLNMALLDLYQRFKASPGEGACIVMQIHDSLTVQCLDDRTASTVETMDYFMNRPVTIRGQECTIPVDYKTGKNWEELKKWEKPNG